MEHRDSKWAVGGGRPLQCGPDACFGSPEAGLTSRALFGRASAAAILGVVTTIKKLNMKLLKLKISCGQARLQRHVACMLQGTIVANGG